MFSIDQYPLNFDKTAMSPYMSAETLEFHHDKHLATYIKNLNDLIRGTKYETVSLNDIIRNTAKSDTDTKIFNNAAQVFNHKFFFDNIRPNGGGKIPDEIADAFGGADKFRELFTRSATALFGSGWTWLVRDGNELKIINMPNADTPIAHNMTPLMTIDVWEHAYYLDYQNRRADFINAFLDHMVNWDFVVQNLNQ